MGNIEGMKPEEYVDLIRFVYREWKATTRDLYVHKAVLNALRTENPQVGPALDKMLDSCKNSAATDKVVANHFEGFEEVIEKAGPDSLEKLAGRLAAKGPIN
jgi:hypothetical protein